MPDIECFVVVEVNGDGQPAGLDLEHAGEELPGPVDRLALEVVTEAEVAQHLEEGHVPRRLAHVLDVAGAYALLASCGAFEAWFAQPHELALELIHAGRREEHRRVVGNEHVAGTADAAVGGKVLEIGFAKVVGFHGDCGINGRVNWVAADRRPVTSRCDRSRSARAGRGKARNEGQGPCSPLCRTEHPAATRDRSAVREVAAGLYGFCSCCRVSMANTRLKRHHRCHGLLTSVRTKKLRFHSLSQAMNGVPSLN